VLLFGALLLAGCGAGAPKPEPSVYLLRARDRVPDGPQTLPVSIGIGRVSVADYLAREGIVVAINGDQVRAARQHLWAEPLESSIALFLRDSISAELGYLISADVAKRQAWDYRLDVRIDEWHGSLDGDVRILASWIVIRATDQKELAQYRFERTAAMTRDGYNALVETQTSLLKALSEAIANSIRGLGS
jgi:hypothetical protein